MDDKTILVVENNALKMNLVRKLLTVGQYRMIEAPNAEKGVELARLRQPDLILMDLQQPGMDGLTAARLIRKESGIGGIPILALSSQFVADDEAKALEAGCNGYLTKPVNTRVFLETVARLLWPAEVD
jgi:CheY-like chemotaxis protein